MEPQILVKAQDVPPLHVLGAEVRFLCEASSTKGAWSAMLVTLPKDSGPPPHVHDWDEAYYVIAGEVQFTVGAECVLATAGDFVFTPGGVAHGFRGVSAEPARVLVLDAPAHAGAFFRGVDAEVRELPRELPKVLEIGERTGIRFLRRAA